MGYDPNESRDKSGRWSSGGSYFSDFHHKSLKQPLSRNELNALTEYAISSDDHGLNHLLRTSGKLQTYDLEVLKNLDSAFSKASLANAIDVHRLVDPDFAKFLNSKDEFTDVGYTSTSVDPDISKVLIGPSAGNERTFKVSLPERFPAILMPYHLFASSNSGFDSALVDEKEVLLNRGTRFIKTGSMQFKASR